MYSPRFTWCSFRELTRVILNYPHMRACASTSRTAHARGYIHARMSSGSTHAEKTRSMGTSKLRTSEIDVVSYAMLPPRHACACLSSLTFGRSPEPLRRSASHLHRFG